MAAPSFTDYFNTGKAEAILRRPELTFDEGDISEMYMAAAAAMADHLTGYTAQRVRETFLDGAVGDALTVLADDRYNIQRRQAVAATGVLKFKRTSLAGGAGSLVAGTVCATQKDAQGNEIQYMTTAAATFSAAGNVWTSVTHKGTGTGTMTLTGTATAPVDLYAIIATPGALGTATVTYGIAGSTGSTSTVAIPVGGVVTDASGAVLTFAGTFTTGDTYTGQNTGYGPIVNNAVALVSGSTGNTTVSTINRIISSTFDSSIVVYNDARFAGGTDAQDDDSLRTACRGFPNTLRRATLRALEYGAINTVNAGVASASAVEDSPNDGIVNVYVADASGGSSPTMVSLVQAEIDNNWRAGGVLVNVVGGALYSLTGIDITLSVRAGVDTAALSANIKSAVVARINKLKVGESCSGDLIKQAAMNVDPDGILAVTVNSPVGTVVPTANQIIRTTTSNVTVH